MELAFVPKDSLQFRASIEALKDFLPQVQLQISNNGIRINGMDSSHVGFVDYFLSKEDCAVLKVPSPVVIGVNTSILYKTLVPLSSGDRVSIGLKEEKLVISYKNEKMSKNAIYEITTLDMTEDVLSIPELSYDASITCKTSDLSTIMKEVAQFGDVLTFRLDEDGFHVSAEGDCGNVRQTLENTEDREMAMADCTNASFATKYILMIMKGGASLAETANLDFDMAKPLRATFAFGEESRFVCYLAPKIQDS